MVRRHRLPRSRVIAVLLLVIVAAPLAQPLPDHPDRVIGLARAWAKAKFFHPYLAYKEIDWDAALVAALPKVEAATTVADYRAAVQAMLAVLGDPVTRVVDDARVPSPAQVGPSPWLTTPAPGVVSIRFRAMATDFVSVPAMIRQLMSATATAQVLMVDLRMTGSDPEVQYAVSQLLGVLPAIDEWPPERSIQHHGFRNQQDQTNTYYSTFVTQGAHPPKPGAPGVSHVVFIMDPDGDVPAMALALQAAGRAVLVAQGPLNEERAVSTTDVELSGPVVARIRIGELLWGPPTADVMVDKGADLDARALAIAKTLITAPTQTTPKTRLTLPALRARNDPDYADEPYPTRERRMLAGIRVWAVIDAFSPYRDLIADWDGVLREMLPRLAAAADREAYRHLLREMGARVGDGHVNLFAPADPAVNPRGAPAIQTRLIEGKLAVVRLLDVAEATTHGITVGDVIETIDGKPAAIVLAERRIEISGSTDESRDQRVAASLLVGDDKTSITVGIRGADGEVSPRTLIRTVANLRATSARAAASPHWKVLPVNVGYVDLRELVIPEVDRMFEDLKGTDAIVFDMRGYPNGTAWPIAPRINTKHAKYGAHISIPLVVGRHDESTHYYVQALQTLPSLPKGAWIYTGKIVVLIDDRAISHAEHSCLFLESAAEVTFIGSPTHGANGDVTVMRLPGGFRMAFTGLGVRHVDGRQLQKIGVQPHVLVRPTLSGIRAGKDEVLDRALAWLASSR